MVILELHKNSIFNQAKSTATKLHIPIDGIIYASILYQMDNGLEKVTINECFRSLDIHKARLSDYLALYIEKYASKLSITSEDFIVKCLYQLIWADDSENSKLRDYYFNKKLDDGSAKKISKTK